MTEKVESASHHTPYRQADISYDYPTRLLGQKDSYRLIQAFVNDISLLESYQAPATPVEIHLMTSSPHLQKALDFVIELDNRNYTALAATMAPDFTHRFLPATLGGLGTPERSKEEVIVFAKGLESIFDFGAYLEVLLTSMSFVDATEP